MRTLRYSVLAVLLVLVGLGYWALVGGHSADVAQASVQNAAREDCACMEKGVIPQDPKERAEFDKAYFRQMAAQQAALMERNRLERLKFRWVGCKFTPSAKEGDQGFERQQSLIGLLSAKQPMPKEREAQYKWMSEYPGCHLVGWYIIVANVSDAKDGEIIELLVRPHVERVDAPNTTVTYTCKETWKLDSNGNLLFQDIRPVGGVMLLTGD